MDVGSFAISFVGLTAIIAVRYVAVAGLFYWLLWGREETRVRARKLTPMRPKRKVVSREIMWSLISSLIYGFAGAVVIEAWKAGGTALYEDVTEYGVLWLPLSVFVYLVLHDTYFYWTHRLMHEPRVFRIMHLTHHQSRQPTPWAAFSFHPTEALLSAIFLPALAFIVPIQVGAAVVLLMLMTVLSVTNHAGWEIFPRGWVAGWIGRQVISATHHNLHHTQYSTNYGLYFRWWDRVMGTDTMPAETAQQARPMTEARSVV